jgi:hypothetical protein
MARPVDIRSEQERLQFEIAALGEHVRFFLTTPVGQYLKRRAETVIQQCEVDALAVDVDTWRGWFFARAKLRKIRQRADAARLLINFLGEAIVDGNAATRWIEGLDEPETP